MLFDDRNLKNENGIVFALNGGAEVFFRPSSLEKKEERRNFPRKIERKKRYTENKIFLHVPVTLNFGKQDGQYFRANDVFNKNILQDQKLSGRVKIIGIDRGEKHLAYYSVIDQKGTILEQGTFNRIYKKGKDGDPVLQDEKKIVFNKETKRYDMEKTGRKVDYIDYQVLLECKEKNRLIERQSWDAIETIKDLKKGYISHVVHQLCELVLRYLEEDGVPPIIAFEKLNVGFKQGRQKIERQVYQNVELALAKKLGYLTKKNREDHKPGGVLSAFQFVPGIKNFGSDVEKQWQVGNIFYVDPSYTSTTCPNCGFRKRITKTIFESVRQTLKKFKEHDLKIYFENGRYKFEFLSFNQKKDDDAKQEKYPNVVYSDVQRVYRKKKENGKGWVPDIVEDMTVPIDDLLKTLGSSADKKEEILVQLQSNSDKDFWSKLVWYFSLILQIRNSASRKYELNEKSNELDEEGFDTDFIHCPQCHFHSEKQETWSGFGNHFPVDVRKEIVGRNESVFNGDANGAYNTARKAILAIERVEEHPRSVAEFTKKHKMTYEELNKKLGNKSKYEITKGKGKTKEIVDSISKYPEYYFTNAEWDRATAEWARENGVK
jgi:CRISPR-associated protein Cpf1